MGAELNTAPAEAAHRLSRRNLLLATAGALVAGGLIVFGAIAPAELGVDPLGLGKLTGLARLWAPADVKVNPNQGSIPRVHSYPAAFRTDVIEIPLTGFLGGNKGSELEYKVRMAKDATVIFDWEVVGTDEPRDFHYDFHGHTLEKRPGLGMTVATYKQAFGLRQHGALIAPFDGIEGWQFSNASEKPVMVRIRLAGFYDLIPAGEEGNLAGIIANVPAPQSRPGYLAK